jgi:hypothetical protein
VRLKSGAERIADREADWDADEAHGNLAGDAAGLTGCFWA